jgi:hypothetical protein
MTITSLIGWPESAHRRMQKGLVGRMPAFYRCFLLTLRPTKTGKLRFTYQDGFDDRTELFETLHRYNVRMHITPEFATLTITTKVLSKISYVNLVKRAVAAAKKRGLLN